MSDKLSTKTYIAGRGTNAALVQFAAMPDKAVVDTGRLNKWPVPGEDRSVDIFEWGAKNDLPYVREELIIGNNIVPALIERKVAILCGQEWYAYRDRYVDDESGPMKRIRDEVPMPAEAKAFFNTFKIEATLIAGEFIKHAMAPVEFIRSRDEKILTVRSLECKYVRAAKKSKAADVPRWYWSNNWLRTNKSGLKNEDKVLYNLEIYTPEKKQAKFVKVYRDMLFNDGYYPIPAYWGGREWIELSNIIPLFHKANLAHGQSPRWHVIIPHDYFYDYEAMDRAITDEERTELLSGFQKREQQFINDLNETLTGIGNTGRTITTKSEFVEALGSKYEKRMQIEELKPDLKDEALLKLYQSSNVANISAQAIHPTLANIETAGKLSSGTEIRNAFLMYLIIAAPKVRNMLTDIVNIVKMENGWPAEIEYGIRDAEMTTLADNPTGVTQSNEIGQ